MATILHQVDTNHEELVHDCVADFYGNRIATCSSDCKIRIFELEKDQSRLLAELTGHEGPVWQLDWSHPEYGNLLASCSYDRKVIIWKEINGNWEIIKEHIGHNSSVNSVQWAPREFGLMLACASSDCSISILRNTADEDWESRNIPNAHSVGANAISWAPPISSITAISMPASSGANATAVAGANSVSGLHDSSRGTSVVAGSATTVNNSAPAASGDSTNILSRFLNRPSLVKRFVSGGCDSLVKIWKYVEESEKWVEERQLDGHTEWVRDVAWAPSIGLPKWYIASCSTDKKVIIWTNNEGPNGHEWESKMIEFNDIVWHVSWSVMGNILAVSYGENKASLYREDTTGEFVCISDII